MEKKKKIIIKTEEKQQKCYTPKKIHELCVYINKDKP